MLIGTQTRELNGSIAEIEKECAKYNLKLNYGTCNYIAMNGRAHIHVRDGTKLKEVGDAVYLGG